MIPEYQQSIEDILKAASPEQLILWQQLRLITGEKAALRQLFYVGPIAGTEFLTYIASKIYFACNIEFANQVNNSNTLAGITFFNENNVESFYSANQLWLWNATAAAISYRTNPALSNNLYFSRLLSVAGFTHMKFIGYRIIY